MSHAVSNPGITHVETPTLGHDSEHYTGLKLYAQVLIYWIVGSIHVSY